jgi:hypothetical protein
MAAHIRARSAERRWRSDSAALMLTERCRGCGADLPRSGGATHPYMLSSPACWARFGEILAREYSHPQLSATHWLSVDSYAVQHPGSTERRAIQSVGLHLARLMLQLQGEMPPRKTNDVMLGLSRSKHTLPYLDPPKSFAVTVADIPVNGTFEDHARAVRGWAAAA